MDRTGVAVVAQNSGTLHEIILQNLMIHDVDGNVYNKHMNNGGIYMTALKPDNEEQTGIARYHGVTVEDCCVWNVSRLHDRHIHTEKDCYFTHSLQPAGFNNVYRERS